MLSIHEQEFEKLKTKIFKGKLFQPWIVLWSLLSVGGAMFGGGGGVLITPPFLPTQKIDPTFHAAPASDFILSIQLPIYLSIYLSICLSVYLSIKLSIYISFFLSIYLSTYLSNWLI